MDPRQFLHLLRRRLTRALVIEGMARIAAIAITAAVLAIAADWLWRLPGSVRCALLVGVGIAALAIGWVRLVRPFRHTWDLSSLALFCERRTPALGGRLITAIDGIPLGTADDQQLRQILNTLNPATLVPARRTPRQLAIAGLALLPALVTALLAPGIASDGLRRLALPFGDAQWRRHAMLEARLITAVVPLDEALAVEIHRQHRDPSYSAPVVVSWLRDDGSTTSMPETRQLTGLTSSTWSTAISGQPGTYRISVSSGDAAPVELAGRIVRRPAVARIAAVITPPAYTGLPESRLDTLAGSLVPGSTVRVSFSLAADGQRAMRSATARLDPGIAIPLQRSELPVTAAGDAPHDSWSGGFTVLDATALVIDANDEDGIALAGPAGGARFPLAITPDRVPTVSLTGAQNREAVTVRAVLSVELAAADDFGLATVQLHGRSTQAVERIEASAAAATATENSSAIASWPVVQGLGQVAGQTSMTRSIPVTISALVSTSNEPQQVELAAVAVDQNDVTGPGIGRSDVLVLRVVPEDTLRQELDRLLSEARERIAKSRDELANAGDAGKRATAMRSSTQAAERASDVLSQVLRRWRDNRMPDDGIAPAGTAQQRIDTAALPALAAASGGDEAARTTADGALAEAERLLSSILQEGDLTRLLQSLIARQTALAGESRTFVRAYLTKALDAPGKTQQQALANRQRELSDQTLDIEHRLLAKEGTAWLAAQVIVRQEAPGDRLRTAATDLGSTDRRPKAVDGQKTAIDSLTRILAALQGTDATQELQQRIGQLAKQQEQLAKELERGAPPASLAARQREVQDATERVQREASANPDTAKLLGAAAAAQQSAQQGMGKGNSTAATRDANAAADLLREAQKSLGGDQDPQKPDEKKPDAKQPDVLALLKELRTAQAALVTDLTLLDQVQGEKPLAFDAQRQVQAFGSTQQDLLLRLREDALKPLAKNPIAQLAVTRVESAMELSGTHLATPALGTRGMRLGRSALTELNRLIEVAEQKPASSGDGKNSGGGSGGQAPQAAFPPSAELALLAAMQADIAARTAAGSPLDVAKEQQQIQLLVEAMIGTVRPETRPWVLLERTRRAMTSSAYQLAQGERSLLTRHEQQAAEAALRRLLAESGGGGDNGGGGGGGGESSSGQQPQQDQGQPQAGDPQQGAQGGDPQAQAQAQGTTSSGNRNPGDGEGTAVQALQVQGDLMQLPPHVREQLRQAREQSFTPAQLRIYQRYLELLEQGK